MESENTIHFTSVLEAYGNQSLGGHIAVPTVYAEMLKAEDGSRRVVCNLNEIETFQCAIMSFGDEKWAIFVNKARQKKLGIKIGVLVEVSLKKDNSEFGLPFPEELEEVLAQEPTAKAYFDALTAGKKRTLIHFVSTAKNVDSRIKKSLIVAQYLIEFCGKVDNMSLSEFSRNI